MNRANLWSALGFISSGGFATVAVMAGTAFPNSASKYMLVSSIVIAVASFLLKTFGPKEPAMSIDANAVVVPTGTKNVDASTPKLPIGELHDLSPLTQSPLTKGETPQ